MLIEVERKLEPLTLARKRMLAVTAINRPVQYVVSAAARRPCGSQGFSGLELVVPRGFSVGMGEFHMQVRPYYKCYTCLAELSHRSIVVNIE